MAAKATRPTSWITRTPLGDIKTSPVKGKPAKGVGVDLLSPKTWLVVGPALIVAIGLARLYRPVVAAAVFALMIRPASAVGDALQGAPRQKAGFRVTLMAFLGLGMFWPAPHTAWGYWLIPWAAIPTYLAVYATRTIGISASSQRKALNAADMLDKLTTAEGSKGSLGRRRAGQFLKLVSEDLTTGQVKMTEAPSVAYNRHQFDALTQTLTIWFTCPQALNPVGSVRAVAGGMEPSLSTEKVRIYDLHTEKAHLFKITFTVDRPFAFVGAGKMPKPRPADEVPEHHYEAGVDSSANPIFVPLNYNAFMAGETRSGKTTQAKVVAQASLAAEDRRTIVIDFKKVDFAKYAARCLRYASAPEDAMVVFAWLEALMNSRLDYMVEHGWETWEPSAEQPFIDVIVDECHDLFTHGKLGKEAALLTSDITAKCSAAGIYMKWATQHPTNESLPRRVKVNCPVKVGFRVADGNACRAVLDEDASAKGFNIADDKLPQGRGVVAIPGEGRRWMHGHLPAAMPKPQDDTPPTPPPTSAWPATPTQGKQGSAGVPTEPERNPVTEPERNTRDRIAAMLNGKPITGTEAAEMVGCTPENARKHLRNLAKEGKAESTSRGYVSAA